MLIYSKLASWWPLLSAPADYKEEADALVPMIAVTPLAGRPTMLELGSGGGNLASHVKAHFRMTLSDRSPDMLAMSRALNPELEHVEGDMRTLRLGRLFDAVLIHDAIMYALTADDLRATLRTAAAHCRDGGTVLVAPDCVRETFRAGTEHGGEDDAEGRGLRYVEWRYDPDPSDTTFEVVYGIVLRDADGGLRMEMDHHVEGLFSREEWLGFLDGAGFEAESRADPWRADVFVGRKRPER
jgi:SAM-dependent methyltransferase